MTLHLLLFVILTD